MMLSDGTRKWKPGLMPLEELIQRMDIKTVPPFLPTDSVFAGGYKLPGFDSCLAERILDINSHGCNSEEKKPSNLGELRVFIHKIMQPQSGIPDGRTRQTSMYPLVALLNHHPLGNSVLVPVGPESSDVCAILAKRDIKEDEEITICYSLSVEVL